MACNPCTLVGSFIEISNRRTFFWTARDKTADFGLSQNEVYKYKKITGFVGTKFYTAPEVIEHLPYTTTADYFSLGLIVYEMALGKHPQEGKVAWRNIMTPNDPEYMDSDLHSVLVAVSICRALPSLYTQNSFQVI